MERRKFIAAAGLASTLPISRINDHNEHTSEDQQLYEWRTYQIVWGGKSQADFLAYLEKALIPALNRHGVEKVGVFKESNDQMPVEIHVLIPYRKPSHLWEVKSKMSGDDQYLSASKDYFSNTPDRKSYHRYTSSLLLAFEGMPELSAPKNKDAVLELRIYEGHNQDAVRRKVMMFNDEEIPLFHKTGLHPVFFAEAIAGEFLPNLTYMLWFKDMEERDANWKLFVDHPEWNTMKVKDKYKNSVSNIRRIFMAGMSISQI